jgi:hypothetical protein
MRGRPPCHLRMCLTVHGDPNARSRGGGRTGDYEEEEEATSDLQEAAATSSPSRHPWLAGHGDSTVVPLRAAASPCPVAAPHRRCGGAEGEGRGGSGGPLHAPLLIALLKMSDVEI